MKKLLVTCAVIVFALAAGKQSSGQTGAAAATASPAGQTTGGAQTRVVGEVTAVDAAARQVVVRTGDGSVVTVAIGDRTTLARVPAGELQQEKASKIALGDVAVGDRVFARGSTSTDGKSFAATQLVVTSAGVAGTRPAGGAGGEGRERPGVVGRVTAVNAQTKVVTVTARSREGAEPLVVNTSGETRFLRFASDSLNTNDAVPGSFADLRIGDQLRARGERSADGKSFHATEILSGTIFRNVATVASVNAATNEVTVRGEEGGPVTVVIGKRSSLKRITPEVTALLAQRRPEGGGERRDRDPQQRDAERRERRERREAGTATDAERAEARERRQRAGGGRNLQELLAGLPSIAPGDLKKGDTVLVTGTVGADASRVTAVSLVTGDAEFLSRLQRMQGRGRGDGQGMNPGLPGDVLGGGTGGSREQP